MRKVLIGCFMALLVLSACGLNTSGEPEIVSEQEVNAPLATATALPLTPTVAAATEESAPVVDSTEAASVEATESAAVEVTEEAAADQMVGLPGDINRGRDLYIQECAQCHGAQDAQQGPSLGGMGERAATRIEGLSAVDYLHQSIVDPGAYVVEGYSNIMPADYATTLSTDDITSLIKFIVEFTPELMMGGASGQPSDTTASGEGHAGVLAVNGKLTQGTPDAEPVGAGQEVDLFVMNFMIDPNGREVGNYTTTTAEDGSFVFNDVARQPGNIYIIELDYAGVRQWQWSEAIEGTEESVTLDVPLYERTTDTSQLVVTYSEILVSYAQVSRGMLEVQWYISMINSSPDHIIGLDETSPAGRSVTAKIELPVEATGLEVVPTQHSGSYEESADGNVPLVLDVWPIRPGENRVTVLRFLVPYEDGAVLDMGTGLQLIDASVMVPNDTVEFESDQFADSGEIRYRSVVNDEGGIEYTELAQGEQYKDDDPTLIRAYDLEDPLTPDQRIIFSLNGKPTRTTVETNEEGDARDVLPLILGGAGVLLLGLAGFLWWRQRHAVPIPVAATSAGPAWEPPSGGKHELLRAIASLDNDFEAGRIDEDTYEERRALLKERLLPLMNQDETPE
ncbi:MAG TPA: cytochrome c [Aggregatilineaceae bacterium]|nr:cytochrome c [Aggregatilineaceae bacterium]